MALAEAAAALVWLATRVEGTAQCPSPADVAERLGPLLPAEKAGAPDEHVAAVEESAQAVWVVLRSPDGRVLGERSFPRSFRCDELASALAVTIAAWESDVSPDRAPSPPRRAQQLPAATALAAPPPAPAPLRLELGAGARLAVAPGDGEAAAFAPSVLAVFGPRGWPLGLRVSADLPTSRAVSVGEGRVTWRRVTVGAGVDLPVLSRTAWQVAVGAEGLLGVFTLARDRLTASVDRPSSLDLGAALGVRASYLFAHVTAWTELAGRVWQDREQILIDDVVAAELGPWEALLTVGLGWRLTR